MNTLLPELEYEPIVIMSSKTINIYFNLTNKNGFFFAGAVPIKSNNILNEPSKM